MNTLVVADRWGRLLDASEPTRGAMHDARSFSQTGLDRMLAGRDVLGDLGFLGCRINTPLRKPPGGKLPAFAQINNRAHSQARAAVERTIALLKQWRVLSGGYRGPRPDSRSRCEPWSRWRSSVSTKPYSEYRSVDPG